MPRCYICGNPKALEKHHIIPQAFGGESGPVVWLDANCHSLVHKQALRFLSKNGSKEELFPLDQWERAKPVVMTIVIKTQQARETPNLSHPTTLMLKVPKEMRMLLHSLKVDAGYTNLDKFCIDILKSYIRSKL